MKLISPPRISPEESCPYIEGEMARHEFFLASELNEEELDLCLSKGFRKFGIYYFRPSCDSCQKCIPLRLHVDDFTPSKSQKRVLKKNKDLIVKYSPLEFREEIYQIYSKHSEIRFGYGPEKIGPREEFIQTHFTPSSPTMLSEYFEGGKLIAVGFLDISKKGLSSVYFIYDPSYGKRSLGVFSVLKEMEKAKEMGKSHYYLGYWIKENNFMNYKNQFYPHELFDWESESWIQKKKEDNETN